MRSERHTIDCHYTATEIAAAYLRIEGDEAAFIECNTAHALPRMLEQLAACGLRPEQVRWILVTHVHLDHAGGAGALAAACPNATVLAHPRAARHLRDPSKLIASAESVYGAEKFAALYGRIEPIASERVRELADGEHVTLGAAPLRALHTRGHAKHHLVLDDPAQDCVYTGDTFGLVYPQLQRAGRFAFPSTSPTDFEPEEALQSLDKVLALGRRQVCLTHFGAYDDPQRIAEQLRAALQHSAQLLARLRAGEALDHAALRAALRAFLHAQAAQQGLSLNAADEQLLSLDLELNAQGIAVAAARST